MSTEALTSSIPTPEAESRTVIGVSLDLGHLAELRTRYFPCGQHEGAYYRILVGSELEADFVHALTPDGVLVETVLVENPAVGFSNT